MSTKILFTIIAIFAAIYLGLIYQSDKTTISKPLADYRTTNTNIGNIAYMLYVADTDKRRVQGLSGVEKLASNEGMLFVFETKAFQSFWMKEMNFPLDLIFLDDSRVVDVVENVSPDSYPQVISSQASANKVIEINAGEVSRNGIEPGDEIRIK